MPAAERRGVLILFAARDLRLDDFDLPGVLGQISLAQVLEPSPGERGDERDVERPRAAEPRAEGRVAARREREGSEHRKPPQRGLEETQLAVQDETARVGTLECLAEILGHQAQQLAAQGQRDVRAQADGGVDDHAAFAR